METLQPEVHTALQSTGYDISYFHPQKKAVVKCISFYESMNKVREAINNTEFLVDVEYVVDLWALTPEETMEMSGAVNTVLSALGLQRTYSKDLYEQETRIHHRNMRYGGIIRTDEQRIYQ